MISFRYHIVSIVAVFLALALGVVIGTTGLNGAILDDLHKQVRDLRGENNTLRTGNDTLSSRVGDGDKFASAYGTKILAGILTGVPIDVITAPGSDSSDADQIAQDITAAGGTVAGRITISSTYIDPASRQEITSLVNNGNVHPAGLTLPNTTDAGTLAGATLAYVLSGKGTAAESGTVLAAFSTANLVKVSDKNGPKAARAAVLVTGGSLTKDDQRSKPLPALVGELNQAGVKTVVAGDTDSASAGGLVATVRGDSSLNTVVSTVDNSTETIGQLSTVLAMAVLLGGQVGHYGTASKAESLFPSVK